MHRPCRIAWTPTRSAEIIVTGDPAAGSKAEDRGGEMAAGAIQVSELDEEHGLSDASAAPAARKAEIAGSRG
jgi:hypothetical protein